VRFWIRRCTEEHRACCSYQNGPQFVPTRLIHLGSGSSLQPRLCITHDIPKDTKYVTLSHCWGRLDILKLQKSNMNNMMHLINISQLCQTFLDAIEVAEMLGVQYIWIDSLCIIQDSPDDWTHESAMMGNVYGNSWRNIAATNTQDGSHGMLSAFRSRKSLNAQELRAKVKLNSNDVIFSGNSANLWREEIVRGPLRSRGWVVRELVLSHRVLHFGKHQIFWDCGEFRACESFLTGTPWSFGKDSMGVICPGVISLMIRRLESSGRVPEDINWLKALKWMMLIEEYSACRLTVPSDRLIAISGLAKSLDFECRYLAGLWSTYLPLQMLWKFAYSKARNESPDPPSALTTLHLRGPGRST
jgi:hypothetical protein